MKINPSFLAIRNDTRSFCERTIIEDFLRLCDIPGTSPGSGALMKFKEI